MNGDRVLTVEEMIVNGVKRLLVKDVNKLLEGLDFHVPCFEFGNHGGREAVVPGVALSSCERTEKERVVFVDAYAVEITVPVEDIWGCDGERLVFSYGAAIDGAVRLNGSLDGTVSRVVITGKEFIPPKKPRCGDCWVLVMRLRVTVEGLANDGERD